ncbi:hypothetical protein ACWCYY_38090 [Kitasatospora sp. NPDC001664]
MTVNYLNDADHPAVDTSSSATAAPSGEAREDLGRYAELGGLSLAAETNPWVSAAETVRTPEDARAGSTALAELRSHDLLATRDALAELLGTAATPASLAELTRLTAILQRAHGTSATLRPEVYDTDLDALTAALAPWRERREQGVKLGWGRRRALRAQAKNLAVDGRTRRADLLDAVRAAAATQGEWASAGAVGRPAPVADPARLTALAQTVEELGQAARALGALLPDYPLDALPLGELADLVDRLAADEGTLYRLPALRALRASLLAAEPELLDLLGELADRQADRDAALAAYDRLHGTATEAEAIQVLAAGPREAEPAPAVVEAVAEEPVAEVEAEPIVEPEPVAEVEPVVEVEPVAEVEAEPIVEPEPVAEVEPVVEPEVEAELEPVAEALTEAEPVVEVEPVAEVEAEPIVEPEPVAEVEPVVEPEVEAELEPVAEALTEAEPEVAPEPAAEEPVAVATAVVEPEPEVVVVEEAVPVVEPEPVVAEVAEEPEAAAPEKKARRPKKPAITAGRAVTAYEPAELVALVRWLDTDGTERSEDELLRAAVKELGFSRVGPRLKEALAPAVAEVRS